MIINCILKKRKKILFWGIIVKLKSILFFLSVAIFGCYISSVDATFGNFNIISLEDVEEDGGNYKSSYEISVYDAKDHQENNNNIVIVEHRNSNVNDEVEEINPYEGKISYYVDGWKIVQSPLEKLRFVNSGLKVYVNGDESSEEVIIDVERSLAFNNYFIIKLYNTVTDIGSLFLGNYYELTYRQFIVMLGLAAEIPYEWGSKYNYPIASPWKFNYESLIHFNNTKMIIKKFKNKFPNCKNIRLKLCNSQQKIILIHGYTLNYLYKALLENGLKIIDEDGLEIETDPKVKLVDD